MAHIVKIDAKLAWAVSKDERTGHLVATCEPLRIVMSGDNHADLDANIRETLHLFFTSLHREGDFDRFLRDHGWTATPMPKQDESEEDVAFEVPWELIAGGRNGQERASRQ